MALGRVLCSETMCTIKKPSVKHCAGGSRLWQQISPEVIDDQRISKCGCISDEMDGKED
jgi:hypothetical protein